MSYGDCRLGDCDSGYRTRRGGPQVEQNTPQQPPAEMQLCQACCLPRAITEFRLRDRGTRRRRICRLCHNKNENRLYRIRRRKRVEHLTAELYGARSETQLRTAVAQLLHLLGGPTGFAATLHAHFRVAQATNPGGREAGRVLLALSRIAVLAQPTEPDYSSVSTEDLERFLDKQLRKLMAQGESV